MNKKKIPLFLFICSVQIYQDAIAIENQGLNEAKHRQTISASTKKEKKNKNKENEFFEFFFFLSLGNPAQIVTYQQQVT